MISISDIQKKYSGKIDNLDFELIIAHSLGKTREFVLAHPEQTITKKQETIIKKNVARRIKHAPLAYIVGHKEFYGLDFAVNKDTLVPRPETELLVELALAELKVKSQESKVVIVDIGTGSGNIIISLAHALDSRFRENDMIKYFGTDISPKALSISKQNAKKHRLDKKITFLKGNLLTPLLKANKPMKLTPEKLILVANLPYLDLNWKNLLKSSDRIGLKFEPSIALYAGKDGLDAYRKLAEQIRLAKTKNSVLFCEIGHLQKSGINKIFSFAKNINFYKDLAGKWRACKISL
jgi:release factor glutamine methyltransferase